MLLVGRGDVRKGGCHKTHSWSSPRTVKRPERSGRCLKNKSRTFGLLLEQTDAHPIEQNKILGIFTWEHQTPELIVM
jgi:hypothetical protein